MTSWREKYKTNSSMPVMHMVNGTKANLNERVRELNRINREINDKFKQSLENHKKRMAQSGKSNNAEINRKYAKFKNAAIDHAVKTNYEKPKNAILNGLFRNHVLGKR
jgi:hypothetical protein